MVAFLGRMSAKTITDVGQIYMSGMSEQISLHFETTIQLRLNQLEAMMQDVPPDASMDREKLMSRLTYTARARGFEYLAFLSQDGEFEMVYGEPITVLDPESFLETLNSSDPKAKKVAVGEDVQGNKLALLGVTANDYRMTGGRTCTALVAALPVEYITETLSLDEDETLVYSFIIRSDGTFIIRTGDAFRDSYFQRVRELYDDVEGMSPEEYITELRQAMEAGEDFSKDFVIEGEKRHLYCTKLAYSEWYLLTFMPYGSLDNSVRALSNATLVLSLVSGIVIVLSMFLVFRGYSALDRLQIDELKRARERAEAAQAEAEQAQRAAEHASRSKSEFLSNMSHDIRTPMNGIVGMTAIATANIDDKDQVQHCLRKIALSSKHLLGLINDVLDMSKIESGKMTLNIDRISLREVMDSIVSIVQPQVKSKRQQFNVSIHDISSENVYCDSVRLNQVLLNLLSNAVKFTPEGGAIYISMWEEPSAKGEEYVQIHIQVKDTGIGMSPEFLKHIFDSFTREDTKRVQRTEGTGLGMAITKYIIDAMEGTITVVSEQGKGSQFDVVLDLEKDSTQEVNMVLPEWNMLVVDDDQQLCESVAASLKSIGVKADWTLDGENAVQLALQRHQRHEDYHIVLLDWKLPGMDGLETARELRRQLGKNMPIVLISAYDWGDIEQEAREAGINGFISKPLFKSTLYYGLRRYADATSDHHQTHIPEKKVDLEGRHVLLAEDNELNWEIAQELLGELNLDLDWAEDGKRCLEKFQQSSPGYYKAILMDVRMPVMNGYEATQAIRALDRPDGKTIPIIAMTADAFAEDVKRCLDSGMNAHVAKPIDIREITRILEKYIKD